ncbi:MAG: YheU family protein [Myxococcales bacterium]|nr:YheU family protein [Myxococcales bacterium]MCB9755341.1 YheU family protein [Myxococcales bacterium]
MSEPDDEPLEIPIERLSDAALLGIVDDFVLREGTDYGREERTLARKREAVLAQLRAGTAYVTFDPRRQSCTILRRERAPGAHGPPR